MKPLVIRVEDLETGESWVYMFDSGPVVFGRGDDVALRIARAYLSLQHGSFDFDDAAISYTDLDSRNGVIVDGTILEGGGRRALAEASEIRIGPLRLIVSRRISDSPPPDPKMSPFARPRVAPKKGGAKPETDVLSREMLAAYKDKLPGAPAPATRPPAPSPGPPAAAPARSPASPPFATRAGDKPAAKVAPALQRPPSRGLPYPASVPPTPQPPGELAHHAVLPPSALLPPEPRTPFRRIGAAGEEPAKAAPVPMVALSSPVPEPMAQQYSPIPVAVAPLVAQPHSLPSSGARQPPSPTGLSAPTPQDAWPPPHDPSLPPTAVLPEEIRDFLPFPDPARMASAPLPNPGYRAKGEVQHSGRASAPVPIAGGTRVLPTGIGPVDAHPPSSPRAPRSARASAPTQDPPLGRPALDSSFLLLATGVAVAAIALGLLVFYFLGLWPRR